VVRIKAYQHAGLGQPGISLGQPSSAARVWSAVASCSASRQRSAPATANWSTSTRSGGTPDTVTETGPPPLVRGAPAERGRPPPEFLDVGKPAALREPPLAEGQHPGFRARTVAADQHPVWEGPRRQSSGSGGRAC
jgi:hypothetical protein